MRTVSEAPKRGRPPRPTPDLRKLRLVAADLDSVLAQYRTLVAVRDRLILQALDAGGAQRVVAEAAGVSRQRVAQLALQRR